MSGRSFSGRLPGGRSSGRGLLVQQHKRKECKQQDSVSDQHRDCEAIHIPKPFKMRFRYYGVKPPHFVVSSLDIA